MNDRQFLYIANWKMALSLHQVRALCFENYHGWQELSSRSDTKIVVCPSYESITDVVDVLQGTQVIVGSQDCSRFERGAFTGDVAAYSLQEAGCKYSLVGHSERRVLCQEGNKEIGQKITQLVQVGIIPIVCIGETLDQYKSKKTYEVLHKQLEPLQAIVHRSQQQILQVCIAYEPVWSIGTGVVPEHAYIQEVFAWMREQFTNNDIGIEYLYGGSVSEQTSVALKKIPEINGFLIGSASCSFQTFKNIVLLQ